MEIDIPERENQNAFMGVVLHIYGGETHDARTATSVQGLAGAKVGDAVVLRIDKLEWTRDNVLVVMNLVPQKTIDGQKPRKRAGNV